MKKIFWILLSVAALSACSDDDTQESQQPQATVQIGAETLTFLPSGQIAQGENAVTVTSSGDWRLTGRKTWCTPAATQGKSGDAVTFTAAPNLSAEPRSEVFTFICGNSTARLVITQRNGTIVDCSQDRYDLDNTGGIIRLRAESNVEMTVAVSPENTDWIIPIVDAPTRSGMQVLWRYYTVTPNDTYNPRSASIVLSSEGMEPIELPVLQAQTDMFRIEGESSHKVEMQGGEVRATVWSNIPFEVVIPEADRTWLRLKSSVTTPEEWSMQELVFEVGQADGFRTSQVTLKTANEALNATLGFQQGEAIPVVIPDAYFRQYLLDKGYIALSGDNYIVTPDGAHATTFDLYKDWGWQNMEQCATLSGVGNFPSLTSLVCQFGNFTELDLVGTSISDLTKCVPNPLQTLTVGPLVTTVDFSALNKWSYGKLYRHTGKVYSETFAVTGENIATINLWRNKLKTLDVRGCPNLKTLDCRMADSPLDELVMSRAQEGKVNVQKDDSTQIIYM